MKSFLCVLLCALIIVALLMLGLSYYSGNSGALSNLDRLTDIAGPDTNGNGVRDDVEAFITSNYAKKAQKAASMQFASAIQATLLVDFSNHHAVTQTAIRIGRAANCIGDKFNPAAGDKHPAAVSTELESIIINTKQRERAYKSFSKAMDGTSTLLPEGNTCE